MIVGTGILALAIALVAMVVGLASSAIEAQRQRIARAMLLAASYGKTHSSASASDGQRRASVRRTGRANADDGEGGRWW